MIVEKRLTARPDPIPWIASGSTLATEGTAEYLESEVVAVSPEATPLEYVVAELVSQLEVLRTEEELPEVLDLEPLATRSVEVRVIGRSRAQFQLIDGDRELLIDE